MIYMSPNNKKNNKKEFLLLIPVIVPILIILFIIFAPQPQYPFFQFAKVSNIDYTNNNSVTVYFISWYGCPFGATDSWGLYIALSNYGTLNVTPNYSDVETIPLSPNQTIMGADPGLIFNSFTPKSYVDLKPIYLLGRIYQNGSASLTNGTLIPWDKVLSVELNELKKEVPQGIYNLIIQYELQRPFENGQPIAMLGIPEHIPSTIIITGKGGTWMMIGYDQQVYYGSPGILSLFGKENPNASQLLFQMINNKTIPSDLSFIYEDGVQINEIILKTFG